MEDTPGMNTFNYLKPGFTDPPTDYYSRPYFRATSDEIDDYGECYLDRPTLEVYYFQYKTRLRRTLYPTTHRRKYL